MDSTVAAARPPAWLTRSTTPVPAEWPRISLPVRAWAGAADMAATPPAMTAAAAMRESLRIDGAPLSGSGGRIEQYHRRVAVGRGRGRRRVPDLPPQRGAPGDEVPPGDVLTQLGNYTQTTKQGNGPIDTVPISLCLVP